MESSLTPATPCLPVAPYKGGKRQLAGRLIARIEQVPHRTYAEAFVGIGGVFLRRPHRAPVEVINDASRDVATLFRVLQRHYEALMDMLRWQVTSREAFDRLLRAAPDTLTDLERAARFLYLQRTSFGGKVTARTFGVDPRSPGRFDTTKLATILEEAHTRLAGVVVECLPWAAFLRRYDRDGTLFYCDPPYWGCETDYGQGTFSRGEFAELADVLRGLRGRWLLSINDVPEIRRLFDGCAIEQVELSYSINNQSRGKVRELIISDR